MSVKIKICGITDKDNAVKVFALQPDFVGFILYPESPRFVKPEKVREIISEIRGKAGFVGVFVNEPVDKILSLVDECGLDHVQLHGEETPEDVSFLMDKGVSVIKAFRLKDRSVVENAKNYPAEYLLFDAFHKDLYGGTGDVIDRDLLEAINKEKSLNKKKIFLSGGLHAANIKDILSHFIPFAVDASSRLETSPGMKDVEKTGDFIKAVRKLGNRE